MTNTIALVTTNQQSTHFKMTLVSWIHSPVNQHRIEISANNESLGKFLLVKITSPDDDESQQKLSQFHDKLLSAMGRFDTQITAYTDVEALPENLLEIDLSKRLVYLITVP